MHPTWEPAGSATGARGAAVSRRGGRVLLLAYALALALALAGLASCRKAPVARDSIVIAVPHEVMSLDPHLEDTLANFVIHSHFYEALVKTDAGLKIVPSLADRWETPDPQTWVLHLRPGVVFHGGKPLRAADVVATYERLLHDKSLQMRAYLTDVAEVREQGDGTVLVKTRQPSSILLHRLSRVLIVPEGHADLRSAADGTGPYTLAEWSPGASLDLRRNERYWGKAPPLRSVRFVLAQTPDEAIEGLLAGRYQLVQCNSRNAESALAGSDRFRVRRRDNLYVKYLGLDLAREVTPFANVKPNPLRDKRVRQAIDTAIDRRALVEGLSNYAVPATQPVPRFVFGFNPAIPEAAYDLERAKDLLRQAGLPGGFEAVLHARRILGETALLLKKALGAIGIRLEVQIVPDAKLYELLEKGKVTMWLSRYGCLGDASEILISMIHSRDATNQFGWNNWEGYSDRKTDEAIERSATLRGPEERRQALQAIMAKVMDELLLIPLYNDQDVYALDRSLSWEPRNDSLIRAEEIAPAP